MSYSNSQDITITATGNANSCVALALLGPYGAGLHYHVNCKEAQNWPIDVAFSTDGGATLLPYYRVNVPTFGIILAYIPLDLTSDVTLTVLWGDSAAPDYHDSTLAGYVWAINNPFAVYGLCASFSQNLTSSITDFTLAAITTTRDDYPDCSIYVRDTANDYYIRAWFDCCSMRVKLEKKDAAGTSASSYLYYYEEPIIVVLSYDSANTTAHLGVQGWYSSSPQNDYRTISASISSFDQVTFEFNDHRSLLGCCLSTSFKQPQTVSLTRNFIPNAINWSPTLVVPTVATFRRRVYAFYGQNTEEGSPALGKIVIYDHHSNKTWKTTVKPDGSWRINLPKVTLHPDFDTSQRFAVFNHDPDRVYNAMIYDHVTPEVEDQT